MLQILSVILTQRISLVSSICEPRSSADCRDGGKRIEVGGRMHACHGLGDRGPDNLVKMFTSRVDSMTLVGLRRLMTSRLGSRDLGGGF